MGISWFLTIFSMLAGALSGGNDLLDTLPSGAYWKSKDVIVSVEAMARELAPAASVDLSKILPDLSSEVPALRELATQRVRVAGPAALEPLERMAKSGDPNLARRATSLATEVRLKLRADSVRRLMAIRTLGELKRKEAIVVLKPVLASAAPFEAEYARAAGASIEGKPFRREPVPGIAADVWLLPADCRAVGQITVRWGGNYSIDAALKAALPDAPDEPKAGKGRPSREELVDEIAGHFLPLIEQYGNVRFDAVTLGVSGDIGERAGHVVAILRGRYDSAGFASLLAAEHAPMVLVDGMQAWKPNEELAFFMPSDDRLVVVASPRGESGKVLPEMIAAVRTGTGKLNTSPEMVKLLKSVDTTQPAWAVAKVTEAYRLAPYLAAFDTVTFVATPRAGAAETVDLKLEASGPPGKAKAAVENATVQLDNLRATIKQGLEQMRETDPTLPARLQFLVDFAQSIKPNAHAGGATLTATFKASANDLMTAIMTLHLTSRAPAPAQESRPVAPPPARPAPPRPPG